MERNKQPNFEIVKGCFYSYSTFVTADFLYDVLMPVLIERINYIDVKSFPERIKESHLEINTWLDGVDISMVGSLIDVLNAHDAMLPLWIKNKEFNIDYNRHGFLDLIKK